MSSTSSDPGRIERELDQTRARLDGHLSELQQLSPGQLLDDAMRYFRGAEGAEFGRNLLQSVRSNPLPAAITGIGLTWLMASNPRPGTAQAQDAPTGTHSFSAGGYSAMTARIRTAEQGVVRRHDEAEHDYAVRLEDARGQALGLARHQEDTSESFSQRIAHALNAAQQAVAGRAGDLRDGAGSAAGSLGSLASGFGQGMGNAAQRVGGAVTQGGHAAGQAGGSLVSSLAESPALLGALGLAAGALLGALVPQSEREEAALGQLAGQARDGARTLAQTAVDGGAHVAQAVLDKGRDSAKAHGLAGGASPGQLVDDALSGTLSGNAKQVAEDLLGAGESAIRKELGQPAEANQPVEPKPPAS